MLIYLQTIETDVDKSKFVQIYNRCHKLMKSAAYGILRDEHDAEDAVHEAFTVIAKNILKVPEPDSPKAQSYAVVITERKAIDILRKRKHTDAVPWETIQSVPSGSDESTLLSDCILHLPEKQRQVIWLRYYFGYQLKEIAEMTGDSYVAVRKTDQRAKETLKRLYEEAKGGL